MQSLSKTNNSLAKSKHDLLESSAKKLNCETEQVSFLFGKPSFMSQTDILEIPDYRFL
jgi:hypothetical protein